MCVGVSAGLALAEGPARAGLSSNINTHRGTCPSTLLLPRRGRGLSAMASHSRTAKSGSCVDGPTPATDFRARALASARATPPWRPWQPHRRLVKSGQGAREARARRSRLVLDGSKPAGSPRCRPPPERSDTSTKVSGGGSARGHVSGLSVQSSSAAGPDGVRGARVPIKGTRSRRYDSHGLPEPRCRPVAITSVVADAHTARRGMQRASS